MLTPTPPDELASQAAMRFARAHERAALWSSIRDAAITITCFVACASAVVFVVFR